MFEPPTNFTVTDRHGGFTAVMRSKDTLWRPGALGKRGHLGQLVPGSVNPCDFYQLHNDMVSALYKIPGYPHPIKVWWKHSGQRLA